MVAAGAVVRAVEMVLEPIMEENNQNDQYISFPTDGMRRIDISNENHSKE